MGDATVSLHQAEQTAPEERRLHPRSKMTEIVYMNLRAENGGIVLDISATGLGFQVASPIAPERNISFQLSAEGIEDVEISAEVAWLDADRKRGGLRFGQLPEKVRTRIHGWLRDSAKLPPEPPPAAPNDLFQKQVPNPTHSARSLFGETNPYSLTQDRSHQDSRRSAVSDRPLAGLPNPLRANSSFHSVLSPEPNLEVPHRRSLSGVMGLLFVLLLVIEAGVFVFTNKRQVGTSMIRLGERISGESAGQSTASAPPTVTRSSIINSAPGLPEFATIEPRLETGAASATSPSISGSGSADSGSQIGAAAGSTPVAQPNSSPAAAPPDSDRRQQEAPALADRARTPDASNFPSRSKHTAAPEKSQMRRSDDPVREDDGHTELALARQYLRGATVPKDRDMAAHLLWVAVGDGNPQAELELADLYLRSDGVPAKNCAQARILLNDSSNSGNLEASQQLAKLRDYGCR